jgi:hypothetical protein
MRLFLASPRIFLEVTFPTTAVIGECGVYGRRDLARGTYKRTWLQMGFDGGMRPCDCVLADGEPHNMQATLVHFKRNRKGSLDVRTAEGKRGEIVERRGAFKFVGTRDVSPVELKAVCDYVEVLNSRG